MPYQNFMVDPKLKKDVWVRASQVRPGNRSVVHHLVVFVIPPGSRDDPKIDFLAGYAPGMPPRVLPDGVARLVPAGSRLLFQVHYTPRGIPQTDRSEIGLVFADPRTIRKEMTAVAAINMDLRIPAGAADYAGRGRPSLRPGHDRLLAVAAHAPPRQVVPVRGGVSRRPSRGAAGRPAVRVRMAERVCPLASPS